MKNTLGITMKFYRMDQNMTCESVADKIGSAASLVNRFENDFGYMSYNNLLKMCNLYKLDEEQIEKVIRDFREEHSMNDDSIGNILRWIRYSNDMTQCEFVKSINYTNVYYSRVERELVPFTKKMLKAIVSTYDIDEELIKKLETLMKGE